MKQLTCEMCGSTDLVKQDGFFVCQTCGCKYSVEEAKKMMIEGTVEIQGTVKVDNSEYIANNLKNAKNAFEEEDWDDLYKYCENIIEVDSDCLIAKVYYRIAKFYKKVLGRYKDIKSYFSDKDGDSDWVEFAFEEDEFDGDDKTEEEFAKIKEEYDKIRVDFAKSLYFEYMYSLNDIYNSGGGGVVVHYVLDNIGKLLKWTRNKEMRVDGYLAVLDGICYLSPYDLTDRRQKRWVESRIEKISSGIFLIDDEYESLEKKEDESEDDEYLDWKKDMYESWKEQMISNDVMRDMTLTFWLSIICLYRHYRISAYGDNYRELEFSPGKSLEENFKYGIKQYENLEEIEKLLKKEVFYAKKIYEFDPELKFLKKAEMVYGDIWKGKIEWNSLLEKGDIGKLEKVCNLELIENKYNEILAIVAKADKLLEDAELKIKDLEKQAKNSTVVSSTNSSASSGGCYVATCVYGSYDCPEVWTLRRYRDDTLGSTWYGRAFIRTYYAISPTLVKWFGKTKWFKKMWKGKLDRMVKKLQDNGVESTPYDDKEW